MAQNQQQDGRQPGRRARERRWRDAGFFLVERRNGDLWKYGSIALALVLMLIAWSLLT